MKNQRPATTEPILPPLPPIDQTQLDKQCSIQPDLYDEQAQAQAEDKFNLSVMEEELSRYRAELDERIRTNYADYGLEKITEDGVKMAINRDEEYQRRRSKILRKQYLIDARTGRLRSLEHRKQGLQDAVILWVNNYNSEPKVPAEAREKLNEYQKQSTRRRVSSGLNKND